MKNFAIGLVMTRNYLAVGSLLDNRLARARGIKSERRQFSQILAN